MARGYARKVYTDSSGNAYYYTSDGDKEDIGFNPDSDYVVVLGKQIYECDEDGWFDMPNKDPVEELLAKAYAWYDTSDADWMRK